MLVNPSWPLALQPITATLQMNSYQRPVVELIAGWIVAYIFHLRNCENLMNESWDWDSSRAFLTCFSATR